MITRRAEEIEAFIDSHPRDPLPDHVFWATERADRANRSSWVVTDALTARDDCEASGVTVLGKAPKRCGGVDVKRTGNVVDVVTQGVDRYCLLDGAPIP